MPIGIDDRIHGWNPDYRTGDDYPGLPRFQSFEWRYNRPGEFQNEVVVGTYIGDRALDHQGHIVPQNLLANVLDEIAEQAYDTRPIGLEELNDFLIKNHPRLNFDKVTTYIKDKLIANGASQTVFIDRNGGDIEDYLGGYFSVILWNPVNICRAPSDDRRARYPGNTVDQQVIQYILQNPDEAGITLLQDMRAPFRSMTGEYNLEDILNFIAAINTTFVNQLLGPAGFYQFPWQNNEFDDRIMIPGG